MSLAATAEIPDKTLQDIAELYHVDDDTVLGWHKRGLPAPGGGRAYLKAVRIGKPYRTTLEWVQEFMATINGGSFLQPVDETPAKAEARAKAIQEKARKALGKKKAS